MTPIVLLNTLWMRGVGTSVRAGKLCCRVPAGVDLSDLRPMLAAEWRTLVALVEADARPRYARRVVGDA